MNDKSIWYREVLEIEPQSRLFYPLARMLAAEGSLAEARAILEKGLSWHVHYVQARMLLCEVLQKLGLAEEAEKQFSLVAGELEGSASFWQAFAQTDAKNRDESLVRRLLALELRHVPVEFSDIVRRGLDSLEKEYGLEAGSALTRTHAATEAGPHAAPVAEAQARPATKDTAAEAPRKEGTCTGRPQSQPVFATAASAQAVSFTASPVVPHAVTCSILNPIRQAASHAAQQAVVNNTPLNTVLTAPQAESPAAAAHEARGAEPNAVPGKAAGMQEPAAADFSEQPDEEPQGWPPKTRSMAEVFVEQGEYAEAVSIYHDLIARAGTQENAAELHKRLLEIEAMAGLEPAAAVQNPLVLEESNDAPDDAAREPVQDAPTAAPAAHDASGELLGLLESLASRVEARVR